MSNEPKNPSDENEIVDPIVADEGAGGGEGGDQLNPPGTGKPDTQIEEEDDTEILALADQVKDKIAKKNKDSEGKTYSQEDVDQMFARLEKKLNSKKDMEEEDFIDLLDPNAVKRKFIRVARLKNKDGEHKFIVGLKNLNTDAYTDEPVYFTQIENPMKKGEMIPWATFIADDGSEILYPYLSFMSRATGVWAEVTGEEKEDVSEKHGTVEAKTLDEDEWKMNRTGKRILAKALKYKTTYVVKEIKGGKVLKISQDVVNKVEAPYPELRKFLELTSN